MADIKLNIINSALTAAGEDPLTSLTPGSVTANAAIENYDAFVEEELENGTWKFATATDTPSLLTVEAGGTLKYQWQIPSEALAVQAVLYNGKVLDGTFQNIEGRIVRCAFNSDVTIQYTWRPDEDVWPARFKGIIRRRMEALFLRVSERHGEAAKRDDDADVKTIIARHTESRQRGNTPLNDGSLVQARMGQRSRRPS